MGRKKKKARKPKKKRVTAKTADRFVLYENSVQEPEADCDFIRQAWRELKGRQPHSVREDFCGTAITAIEWVRQDASQTAIGIDFDAPTLAVARERIQDRLKPADRARIRLIQEDVLQVSEETVDCILATNFSYYIFKERDLLRSYFKAALGGLKRGGVMILDAYGGSDAFLAMEEPRDCEGFTYIWDQEYYSPVTGDVINHIHFEFEDGSRLEKAFTYEWRLWTLPEIQEMLREAGFREVTVYWEGTDPKTDEGDGVWSVTKTGDADKGWVAYLVAEK
jgi:cyclopropane fatty-acyl-phospholipid synthase-like methyltransferase